MAASAPAIIGTWHNTTENAGWFEPTGCVTRTYITGDGVSGSNGWFDRMTINASRSSSIYGSSNTIRPISKEVRFMLRY